MKSTYYTWKMKIEDESGERYVTPMSDPWEHEFPYDSIFKTPEDALRRLREDLLSGFFSEDGPGFGQDPSQWVLVRVTEVPIVMGSKDPNTICV